MSHPQYYAPYDPSDDDGVTDAVTDADAEADTDADADADADADTDISDEDEDEKNGIDRRIGREQDPRYAILRKPTPKFITPDKQVTYANNVKKNALGSSVYDTSTDVKSLKNYKYLKNPKTTKTSLLSIKSSDRDATVYPSPFNFKLKLPRVYKNVVRFQFVQMTFPNNQQDINTAVQEKLVNLLESQGIDPNCVATYVSCLSTNFYTTPFVPTSVTATGQNGTVVNSFGYSAPTAVSGSVDANSSVSFTTAAGFSSAGFASAGSFQQPQQPHNLVEIVNLAGAATTLSGVPFIENARTNSAGEPLLLSLAVPKGTYNTSQLAQELTFQANSTPPFNMISYPDFADAFKITRDILILFNEPSDTYYSKINNKRLGRHSKLDIMNTYYTQQCIDSIPEITDKVAFNAYYYPVIKELIATGAGRSFLTTRTAGVPYHTLAAAVLDTFLGLDSELYYQVGLASQSVLDEFRKQLTFEYRPINKYDFNFNQTQNKLSITYNTLHTSLKNELTYRFNVCQNRVLSQNDIDFHTFSQLKSNSITYNSIFTHLNRNLSSMMGNYYGTTTYEYTGGSNYQTSAGSFNAETDLQSDDGFASQFNFKGTFGDIYGNYTGLSISFSTFMDYHSTLSTYYSIVQEMNSTLSSINGAIFSDYHNYITNKYSNVFPAQYIQNKSYLTTSSLPVNFKINSKVMIPGMGFPLATNPLMGFLAPTETSVTETMAYMMTDGIPFSTLSTCAGSPSTSVTPACAISCNTVVSKILAKWYGCLPVNQYVGSLGYRLGFSIMPYMSDNILNGICSISPTGTTDLLMKINDDLGFNNIDITMPENYSISNLATGQIKLFAAKVLFDVNSTAQSLIQNPVVFPIPLGKLDKLEFKIYYDDATISPLWTYYPYNIATDEWTATFQIDEEIGLINLNKEWSDTPTIPIPDDPSKINYMGLVLDEDAVIKNIIN
jgi:hypothetical protein